MIAPLQVLIADDDPGIRDLVAELLEEAGYAVQAVGDGFSALVAIRATRPALALLDVAMPVMTGDETLRQLRTEEAGIPVIIMTASRNPQRFLQEGAVAVLAKPFDLDRLLRMIAQTLAAVGERHLGA